VDIDGDGILDIVSGCYSRDSKGVDDMAGTFQVLYGNSDGTFRKAQTLNGSDGKPLLLPGVGENELTKRICTRQFIVDWDGDGKLDLVTGNFEGGFYWFKGEGKGKFNPKAEPIMVDGKPLKLPEGGHHSDPFVIDFDGDGDLDLLSGSTDAGVYIAENVAGKGKPPVLKPFKALIFPAGNEWAHQPGKVLRETDLKRPTYGCRIWVDDVNGDGKLDILVGDDVTLVSPKNGVSEAEMQKKQAEWQKQFNTAQQAYSKAMTEIQNAAKEKAAKEGKKLDQNEMMRLADSEALRKAQQEYSKVYAKRSDFMTEEMTGFVWLYLQK